MAEYSDYSHEQMFELLETLHDKYNCEEFIDSDPISIPHSFASDNDKEVAGFLAATIAWGNRKAILKGARKMMELMDNAPYDFVLNATEADLNPLRSYVYRTFNGNDFVDFICALQRICRTYGTIGTLFEQSYLQHKDMAAVLSEVRREFFAVDHSEHSTKHFSSIDKGAACKRLNMYLRWFVRRDDRGVDFGHWTKIPMSALYIPLDLHTGRLGRAFGLLERKQNDWKAVEELTASLRELSKDDPTRYDYSLFGAGVTKLYDL